MGVDRRKLGYFLGAALSAVATVIAGWLILASLLEPFAGCFMNCGDVAASLTKPLLLFGGYLLVVVALAVLARRLFKSSLVVALLWNVSPLLAAFALASLWLWYGSFSDRADVILSNWRAVRDAPAIRLGEPFVRKADVPDGGAILFLHVPFTVTKPVRARSLNILVTAETLSPGIGYSRNPNCNAAYTEPPYGFHVVDREYKEPVYPINVTGLKVVSERLEPGKQYYLLRELHFNYSLCRVSDYPTFDPAQLKVTLSTSHAWDEIRGRPPS